MPLNLSDGMDTVESYFRKIGNQRTLSQEIVDQIEKAIREKKLLPGQKLPTEKELCEIFSVSRTAVREALQMLNAKGLITIRKGSGIFVNEYTVDHVSDPLDLYFELNFDEEFPMHLIHVRQMIEPQIARLAARNRKKSDLESLHKAMDELLSCANDPERAAECDIRFHMAIVEASGNPILLAIMPSIYKLMPRIKSMILDKLPDAKQSGDIYHQRILKAIEEGDEEAAFEAMKKHLEIAEEHTNRLIEVLQQEKADLLDESASA